jgi:hypothetical protein
VEIAANQLTCPSTIAAARSSYLSLQQVVTGGASVLCGMSTGAPRPLIPEVNRWQIFAAIHGLAHPATRAMRRLLAARIVWRGMNSDVPRWIRDCQSCTRGKDTM